MYMYLCKWFIIYPNCLNLKGRIKVIKLKIINFLTSLNFVDNEHAKYLVKLRWVGKLQKGMEGRLVHRL